MWSEMSGCPTRNRVLGATATIAVVTALEHIGSGKVREIFRVDDDRFLIVATDRISAFDVVLGEDIPHKGAVLTGVSIHWFDMLDTPHHLITANTAEMDFLGEDQKRSYAGRSMLVHAAEVIPMECVIRGYLYGSSWKEYSAGGGPTTEHLPTGLSMASKLDAPIFTPATKAESGHDENLTEAEARTFVGDDLYERLQALSLSIYKRGAEHAASKGIILADTKFEFGTVGDDVILIDEVLTPDSSRYWPADAWHEGATMPSFDKQPVRDWLENQRGWDKTPPAPEMPQAVITETSNRYIEAYERLTGRSFENYLSEMGAQ
jgi:phosphoribosylaminoimidazole-succinocarboxamide synthase